MWVYGLQGSKLLACTGIVTMHPVVKRLVREYIKVAEAVCMRRIVWWFRHIYGHYGGTWPPVNKRMLVQCYSLPVS